MSSKILEDFKNNVKIFVQELMSLLPNESNLILLYIYIDVKITKEELINSFIKFCMPYKDQISERNETFFLDFELTDQDETTVNYFNNFKKIWKSDEIDNDDRKTIWDWFELFMKLSEKYLESLKS